MNKSVSRLFLRARPRTSKAASSSKSAHNSIPKASKRTIFTNSRLSLHFQTTRNALAVECSSLRFKGYVMNGAEENMLRGWDDSDEDEDGT